MTEQKLTAFRVFHGCDAAGDWWVTIERDGEEMWRRGPFKDYEARDVAAYFEGRLEWYAKQAWQSEGAQPL